MSKSFFFYDLETSGLNPREDRIMQFAGQRTDQNLKPIGEPINELIKLGDDVLPSPEALLVTGITPQATVADGFSEAEFAKKLIEEVFTPNTITVGFNNIRFDDEFIRHFLWRNFHDPYRWSWQDGRSRWDMLDVVRMTRALRPEGIQWPVNEDGKPTNRLELLTKLNSLEHDHAHDALSDVEATIAVARMIKHKQPQLFDYLLTMRDKRAVQKLVNLDDKVPFVYTSGRYDNEFQKTTVAFPLTIGRNGNVVVYDLRHDPTNFLNLTSKQINERLFASWQAKQADDFQAIPIKELQYNRSPAVAPLGVLEADNGWEKIGLTKEVIEQNKQALLKVPSFAENVRTAIDQRPEFSKSNSVEGQLYDGFLSDRDQLRVEKVQQLDSNQLADFHPNFEDERLPELLLHYKGRNFSKSLSASEEATWEQWRNQRLADRLPSFIASMQRLAGVEQSDANHYVLAELQLWVENIMPTTDYNSG